MPSSETFKFALSADGHSEPWSEGQVPRIALRMPKTLGGWTMVLQQVEVSKFSTIGKLRDERSVLGRCTIQVLQDALPAFPH